MRFPVFQCQCVRLLDPLYTFAFMFCVINAIPICIFTHLLLHCHTSQYKEIYSVCFVFLSTVKDALDDIPDSPHKHFMKQYIKDWPYPHLTQYRAGQTLNAELNGVQQRCEVQVVDCSLIQVVFQVSIR